MKSESQSMVRRGLEVAVIVLAIISLLLLIFL